MESKKEIEEKIVQYTLNMEMGVSKLGDSWGVEIEKAMKQLDELESDKPQIYKVQIQNLEEDIIVEFKKPFQDRCDSTVMDEFYDFMSERLYNLDGVAEEQGLIEKFFSDDFVATKPIAEHLADYDLEDGRMEIAHEILVYLVPEDRHPILAKYLDLVTARLYNPSHTWTKEMEIKDLIEELQTTGE